MYKLTIYDTYTKLKQTIRVNEPYEAIKYLRKAGINKAVDFDINNIIFKHCFSMPPRAIGYKFKHNQYNISIEGQYNKTDIVAILEGLNG